jgi:hypothetical protein
MTATPSADDRATLLTIRQALERQFASRGLPVTIVSDTELHSEIAGGDYTRTRIEAQLTLRSVKLVTLQEVYYPPAAFQDVLTQESVLTAATATALIDEITAGGFWARHDAAPQLWASEAGPAQ